MPPPPRTVARTGRTRVIGALTKTYLSRVLEGDGDVMTCTDKQEALQVTFVPSEKPHVIEVLVSLRSLMSQQLFGRFVANGYQNMGGPHR